MNDGEREQELGAEAAVFYSLISEGAYYHLHILLVAQTNPGKMVGATVHVAVDIKSRVIGVVWEGAATQTLIMKVYANFQLKLSKIRDTNFSLCSMHRLQVNNPW